MPRKHSDLENTRKVRPLSVVGVALQVMGVASQKIHGRRHASLHSHSWQVAIPDGFVCTDRSTH